MANIIEDINDPTNITGVAPLLNKTHLDPNLDAALIEKDIIGRTGKRRGRPIDPEKEYIDTMRKLADAAGIPMEAMDLGSSYDSDFSRGGSGSYTDGSSYDSDEYEDDSEEWSYEDEDEDDSSDENNADFVAGLGHRKEYKHIDPDALHEPRYGRDRSKRRDHRDVFRKNTYGAQSTYPLTVKQREPPRTNDYANPYANPSPYPGLMNQGATVGGQGGEMQNQFNQVMQKYGAGGAEMVAIERERQEENKTIMLEDIDQLCAELEEEEVDLSRIPPVNQDSSVEDVKLTRQLLRMKYDRIKFTSFGTEFILAAVHGLEYLFDGKRKWGPYSPDLTNWHNTVRTKMRRMKYETSTIVAGIMHDYNIGSTSRVALELIPSAFLHSRMRKEQHGRAGLASDQMSDSFAALRMYDDER